jgi:hypothetical protein
MGARVPEWTRPGPRRRSGWRWALSATTTPWDTSPRRAGALLGDEYTELHTEEVEGPQPHAYAAYLFTKRAVVLLEERED